MVFSFARVGAAVMMRVGDYFQHRKRLWLRLREKGGKRHEVPCHPRLEGYLDTYIKAAGIARDNKGRLFRSMHKGGQFNGQTDEPVRRFPDDRAAGEGGRPAPTPPAATPFKPLESRPTSRTEAHCSMPGPSPTTNRPGRPNCTTEPESNFR